MSGGLDQPLVTRLVPSAGSAARNMAFIADRQGTTLAAVHPPGLRDETAAYFGRNVFGTLEGATGTGSSSNAETGFTGASTPNQTGGFTYLRNRWYDPQSGRFLTQDPIGLAGGVNLYAYAGNNPVSYSDPYGLCPPPFTLICAQAVVLVLRSLPYVSSIGAAMTGLSNGPGPAAANPRAGASLARLAATFEANVDKLDDVHLGAAAREAAGEVVAWNQAAGRPFDHGTEVRSAMQGMRNVISGVDRLLSKGRPTAEQRAQAETLKSQAVGALTKAQETLAGQERQ
jgi:RHS repeat-associated protein